MTETYAYRKASPADKMALQALGISSYVVYAAQLEPEQWEKLNVFLHDQEKLEALMHIATCFVCVCNNQLVGYGLPYSSWKPD
jgi:hypothetical protein